MPSVSSHNFMLADFCGVASAFSLFSFLTIFPGYTLGWLLDVLHFRRREGLFRFVISIPLSIALGPVLSYFIGSWISLETACVFFAVLSAAALPLILLRNSRKTTAVSSAPGQGPVSSLTVSRRAAALFALAARRRRTKLVLAALALGWCLLATLALCDIQIGRRLYFSVISLDYAVRTEFVSAISTFGVPARNPFFYPGHPVALRYHYFWLIQSALEHKVAARFVDARQALIAGTMWCGIGVMATIALYLRFFRIRARLCIAIALLGVTGLDLVPALFLLVLVKCGLIGALPPSVEWWNDQVDGWLYTMLWEPHYVSGVIACLFGFLVISKARGGKARLAMSGIVAGLAFATSVGAAIYVAFVFAVFLIVWSVFLVWKRWSDELFVLFVAGATAAICSWPFLASLRGPGSGGAFLHLTVRSFVAVDVLAKILHFSHSWETYAANALLLPLNYFMELGFFFIIGIMKWRQLRRTTKIERDDLALAVMAIVSVGVCTFLRSGVITNNDLGWRGFLIAQFVLLIWGAQILSSSQKKTKLLISLLIVGVAGTIYDQVLLRFYPMFSDARVLPKVAWLAQDEKLGERTYANREAYEWLRAHSTVSSMVQQNPNPVFQDTFYGLYANRSTIAEDIQCMSAFGGNPSACAPLQNVLQPIFAGRPPPDSFSSACAALPLDFVVAKDTDAAWASPDTWVWRRTPLFANRFVRVFACPARTIK